MNHTQESTQIQLHAERAIEVRRQFDQALSDLNAAREQDGLPPLRRSSEGGVVSTKVFPDSYVIDRHQKAEGLHLPSAIRVGDVITKIIVVALYVAFAYVAYRCVMTGALERLVK